MSRCAGPLRRSRRTVSVRASPSVGVGVIVSVRVGVGVGARVGLDKTCMQSSDLPIRPAATTACLRDGNDGVEVLLVRRSRQLVFYGSAWAFPGGRVDPEDAAPGADLYDQPAGRNAAVREARVLHPEVLGRCACGGHGQLHVVSLPRAVLLAVSRHFGGVDVKHAVLCHSRRPAPT